MISVMNEFEIDRNPTSAPNPSFFVMESPKEEESMDPIDPEISQSLDLPVKSQDLEDARVRVSPAGDSPRSPTGVSERNEAPLDMNGFVIGDMVWGKVKSHPWWPGHIFNESFASPAVRRTKRDGFVLVAFFGDSSYGWFDPAELIPYDPTFVEKSKQTTSRSFVRAVEESLDESSRRAALALSCRCRNPYNFRPTKNPNYFEVDVVGYERNGIYSKRQINNERDSFDPKDALDFLCWLAVTPEGGEAKDLEWHRNVARALAVRTARYEEFDETYAQAFGQQLVRPARDEMGVPEQAERFIPRGIIALMPVLEVHNLYLNSLDYMILLTGLSLCYHLTCLASSFYVCLWYLCVMLYAFVAGDSWSIFVTVNTFFFGETFLIEEDYSSPLFPS